jgi:hypothetical protein
MECCDEVLNVYATAEGSAGDEICIFHEVSAAYSLGTDPNLARHDRDLAYTHACALQRVVRPFHRFAYHNSLGNQKATSLKNA